MRRRSPRSALFPYTTLFRSLLSQAQVALQGRRFGAAVQFYESAAALAPNDATFRELALARAKAERSEEHTSELQSHSDLVCRLLLEKKKGAVCRLLMVEAQN